MARVTQIKPQKSSRGRSVSGRNQRVNVYLDNKFAFGLPTVTLVKAGLTVGQELSEKEVEDLIFKNEFQKLLDKTLRLISLRPRSEKEIRDYLKKKITNYKLLITNHTESGSKIKDRLIDEVIRLLKKQNLVDDSAFTAWWLEQRAAFRPRGKFGLKSELGRKGVDREVIEKALQEIDEVSLAKKAAAKKARIYKNLPAREFRQKMSAFLARQGFSWETIREVLEKKPALTL